jgi:hypothetical protein
MRVEVRDPEVTYDLCADWPGHRVRKGGWPVARFRRFARRGENAMNNAGEGSRRAARYSSPASRRAVTVPTRSLSPLPTTVSRSSPVSPIETNDLADPGAGGEQEEHERAVAVPLPGSSSPHRTLRQLGRCDDRDDPRRPPMVFARPSPGFRNFTVSTSGRSIS